MAALGTLANKPIPTTPPILPPTAPNLSADGNANSTTVHWKASAISWQTPVVPVFVLPFYLATESKHASTENRHNPAPVGITVITVTFLCTWKVHGALRACVWRRPSLPSHFDPSQLTPPKPTPLPSPYSASSAYSYSYAYSHTLPSSRQGRGRIRTIDFFKKRHEVLTRQWASNFWHAAATSTTCHPRHQFPVIFLLGAPPSQHRYPQPAT